MTDSPRTRKPADSLVLAGRIHSSSIRLLRRLRRSDSVTGLSAPRLSALSVVVFGGPLSPGALAEAEQVRRPTMTRLLQGLEREGLVRRRADPSDGRGFLIEATRRGRAVLRKGRLERVASLGRELDALSSRDRELLTRALPLLERVAEGLGSQEQPRSPGREST